MKKIEECSVAAGLVMVNGKALPIVIDTPLLVFDADSWGRSLRVQNFERSKELKISDPTASREYFQISEAITSWLEKDVLEVHGLLNFYFRQRISPRIVNRKNLKSYLKKIVSFGRLATESDTPRFLLLADLETPTLYCLEGLRVQASHAGTEILGLTVSREELLNLIAEEQLRFEGLKLDTVPPIDVPSALHML